MKHTHHIDTNSKVMAACMTGITIYALMQAVVGDDLQDIEASNHALVVTNMSAGFQSFSMCEEQAAMLAEQTADFGVLGMMTTVAAIGIDVSDAHSNIVVERQRLEGRVLAVNGVSY